MNHICVKLIVLILGGLRRMSERSDNYEVEVFVKDNKIIVLGKIRPIYLCVGPVSGCAYVDSWGSVDE